LFLKINLLQICSPLEQIVQQALLVNPILIRRLTIVLAKHILLPCMPLHPRHSNYIIFNSENETHTNKLYFSASKYKIFNKLFSSITFIVLSRFQQNLLFFSNDD